MSQSSNSRYDARVSADEGRTTRMPQLARVRIGGELGDYAIERELGAGGMGAVYLVQHGPAGRRAALKVLRLALADDQSCVARFERETRVISTIAHPNVVELYEYGCLADGRPFYVMEYLPGESLAARIIRTGALSTPATLDIASQVAQGLEASHAARVIHRDVKPSNVVLAHRRDREVAVVVDFGVAKLLDDVSQLTGRLNTVGSPSWMAPEQVRGRDVTPRTDVYGLAAVAYTALTGRKPFTGTKERPIEMQHLTADRPRASTHAFVSERVDDVIRRGMAIDPAERPATPCEFVGELIAASQ